MVLGVGKKAAQLCLLRRVVKCPFRINGIKCFNGILITEEIANIFFTRFRIIFLNVLIKK